MAVIRSWAVILLLVGCGLAFLLYTFQTTEGKRHFSYGLDLVGGSHLVYEADTSNLSPDMVDESMRALRDVIERRVNIFGVSEPLVQVEHASVFAEGGSNSRLIVELPGITDLTKAVAMIGETPRLEFKLVGKKDASSSEPTYIDTGLTGSLLQRARLEFQGGGRQGGLGAEPVTMVDFNSEGRALFGKITTEHVGEQLAIFLDGALVSEPVIREPITSGTAVISGNFTADEAKSLVRNLNIGALPVPITLASTESVGATLGAEMLQKGIRAGLIGLALVFVFMLFWYRLPGLVATLALVLYLIFMLTIFMWVPVTITAAGIAGFILSIGMAVDANVLIFERTKEELKRDKDYVTAVRDGFSRAWPPIRDGNLTSLISAVVLFWFGTSIVKGFALVFGFGVLMSMFTAITVTRLFMLSLSGVADRYTFLLGSGLKR